MTIIIVSPNCTADSAEDLAVRLGVTHQYIDDYKNGQVAPILIDPPKIINWGCSRIPNTPTPQIILNKPRAVRRSLNKIRTFELLSEHVRMPVMTQDMEIAHGWAFHGRKVVVRDRVKGCKSQGITITNKPEEILNLPAKFYTRFIANCTEYRVNVYKGQVLTVYRKEPCNGDFRFKIILDPIAEATYNETLKDFINNVHEHIKLDVFGLDMLYTPKGKWFLLEVNSAPILFPITYKRLANKIKQEYM